MVPLGRRKTDEVATVLEFFGIKLTTPNQQFANVLTTDVRELFQADAKELLGRLSREARAKNQAVEPDSPGLDET